VFENYLSDEKVDKWWRYEVYFWFSDVYFVDDLYPFRVVVFLEIFLGRVFLLFIK
jgi:hypothetical protein